MGPTPAELARTAVAHARVGTLTTYGRRCAGRPLVTVVRVCGAGGDLVVRVREGSPAAADLLSRPLATVRVGPPGLVPVQVQGGAARLPGRDAAGLLSFRVAPGSVRVGADPCAVADYLSADPDHVLALAPALLAHLASRHRDALAACARAHGAPPGSWVEPTGLDRLGLTLTALTAEGATRVRLDFPYAVAGLDELPHGLRALLSCRCEEAQP